ncbi:hypothetical protein A0V28_09530 [Campylobacter jejuni]|nr:hypothetical protein [Campylobacter coli]EAL2730495.1 hypothetical protein [Campylobacter jejuni]EIA79987.1 hypothetical protein cco6_05753 [Campylobacter coli 59-2]EAH4468862.1 hypothetical protein [Campylobacter coli]EAH4484827.1 hypothetical protein [Campylobacter coli]
MFFLYINPKELFYKDIGFVFCLGNAALYHFIYEQLVHMYSIAPKHGVISQKSFFTPEKSKHR